MKYTVRLPVEVEIKTIKIVVPIYYDDEEIPYDFPGRSNDIWTAEIDIDTGKIKNYPKNKPFKIHIKVTDGGAYYLVDDKGFAVGFIEEDYVPHGVIPGKDGDYIIFDIDDQGFIQNWKAPTDLSEFFTE